MSLWDFARRVLRSTWNAPPEPPDESRRTPTTPAVSPNVSRTSDASPSKLIYFYGFDRVGWRLPSHGVRVSSDVEVRFLRYGASFDTEHAAGLVFHHPLFESWDTVHGPFGGLQVQCDRSRMLDVYREARNFAFSGGWVCCLVGRIIDSAPFGRREQDYSVTDLAKLLLNDLGVRRREIHPERVAAAVANEFGPFMKKWGVAQTELVPTQQESMFRPLARVGEVWAGFEVGRRYFFLPFHSPPSEEPGLASIAETLVPAVESYIRKQSRALPAWIDVVEFAGEREVKDRIRSLHSSLDDALDEADRWRQYKAVLVRSGEGLREAVALVLRDFFGLRVGDADVGHEDLAIQDLDGSTIVVVEVKGTKGGVKREYINQVDSHRERNGVGTEVPGILLINDFMEIDSLDARRLKSVAHEQVVHAVRLNVLVIRSTDLLAFMLRIEDAGDRGEQLLALADKGGGLLVAGNEEVRIDRADSPPLQNP